MHGNEGGGEKSLTEKGILSRLAMKKFFSLGENLPVDEKVHLPPMEKRDVWDELKRDLGENMISESYFIPLWKKEFKNVTVPKDSRLGKCDECVNLKDAIVKEKDPVKRGKLKESRSKHLSHVKNQTSYYERRDLAQNNPNDYLSIIIDGMDRTRRNWGFLDGLI